MELFWNNGEVCIIPTPCVDTTISVSCSNDSGESMTEGVTNNRESSEDEDEEGTPKQTSDTDL